MFQKFFATLLTYVIGAQLILSSVPHGNFSSTAWAQSCGSGLQWSDAVGRCVTSDDAAKIQNASAQCAGLGTQELKKKCFEDAITAKVSEAESDGTIYAHQKVNPNIASIILAMAGIYAAFQMSITATGDCLMAYSKWSFIIGSLAVIAGEVLSAITYKNKMKDAEKEVAEENSNSKGTNSDNVTATDTQLASLVALEKKEDATIAAGKTKKTLYTVAAVAHGVAAAIATYEIIAYHAQMVCPGPCGAFTIQYMCTTASANATPPGISPHQFYANRNEQNAERFVDNYFKKNQRVSYSAFSQTNSILNEFASSIADLAIYNLESKALYEGKNISPDEDAYFALKKIVKDNDLELDKETITFAAVAEKMTQQFMVNNAHAAGEGITLILAAAGAGGIALIQSAGYGIKKMFFSPYTRLILAGVYLANDLFMISHIKKQIEKAEERKTFVQGLAKQVAGAGAEFGCTTNDRNSNLSKPNCYCYTESGTLNPSRSNSATCKSLFGGKPIASQKKTDKTNQGSSTKACITKSGGIDNKCGCAKTKTCAQSPSISGGNGVPAGLLGSLPTTVNGLTNGSLSAQDIDMDSMEALGARAKKFQENLISKNPKLAQKINEARNSSDKVLAKMRRDIMANPKFASLGSGSSGNFNTSDPNKALEQMKEELKQEIKGYDAPVVPVAGGEGKKAGEEFNLGIDNEGEAITIEEEKLAEVMNSEFDMSAGEINGDTGANIFDILTNRYQRSGMRRLFGGEAMVPADKPNETEISQ